MRCVSSTLNPSIVLMLKARDARRLIPGGRSLRSWIAHEQRAIQGSNGKFLLSFTNVSLLFILLAGQCVILLFFSQNRHSFLPQMAPPSTRLVCLRVLSDCLSSNGRRSPPRPKSSQWSQSSDQLSVQSVCPATMRHSCDCSAWQWWHQSRTKPWLARLMKVWTQRPPFRVRSSISSTALSAGSCGAGGRPARVEESWGSS